MPTPRSTQQDRSFDLEKGVLVALAKEQALVATKAFDQLDAPPELVTPPHTPVPFSPTLEDSYLPDAATIVKAIRKVVGHEKA